MSEFNLSDKIVHKVSGIYLDVEDVKEFIKRLKGDINLQIDSRGVVDMDVIELIIDKIVGDKLTKTKGKVKE